MSDRNAFFFDRIPAMTRPLRYLLLSLPITALSACASWQPDGGTPEARAAASGTCNAEAVQWALGQTASSEVTGRVWRESHAGLIRPLRPEQVAGASTRADRVTVELDRENVIRRVYCG